MKHVLEKDTQLLTHKRIPVLPARKSQEAMDSSKQKIFNEQQNEVHKNVRVAFVEHMYILLQISFVYIWFSSKN